MRKGDWIQTFTGVQFWPLDPRPEEIFIIDIAHALSNICRFGGHSRCFYSVAEHSVIVSEHVSQENKLAALLHDATEAYLGDMVRPLKRNMSEYRVAEYRLHIMICERFGLPVILADEIKLTDNKLLLNEKNELMGLEPAPWGLAQIGVGSDWRWARSPYASEPLDNVDIMGWHPLYAKELFLLAYERLSEKK